MVSAARAVCGLAAAICAGCWSAGSVSGQHPGADADADMDGDVDADSDSDSDADTDSGTEVACGDDGPCSGAGLVCNENWGICVAASCAGQDDFTPCEIITAPDRSFDICVDEGCVSPGCGDATCNTPGSHFPLPDTNQRSCYDDSAEVVCPGPGADFFGQDAQHGWDVGHPAAERFARDLSVPGEPVVTDNVSGLVWQGCTMGILGDDCTGGSAAKSDWSTQIASCDALDWGGHTDWRLPDPYELATLLDRGKTQEPHIDETAFPATPLSSYSADYWSSSTSAADAYLSEAVVVNFGWLPELGICARPKYDLMYARCVRGGPMKTRKLVLHDDFGDRVVEDTATGLQWQGCAHGQAGDFCGIGNGIPVAWEDALAYCENQFWGGHDDWRLPNAIEIQSLASYRLASPSIDTTLFPEALYWEFWSSSSDACNPGQAWLVSFSSGNTSTHPFDTGKTFLRYVRCVRGGQWD